MTADNFSEAARAEAVRPGRKQADPVTEQQIDQLRAVADHAEQVNSAVYLAPRSLRSLLDQLDQAEAELDSWMTRTYEAEGKLWKAEARIRAVRALHAGTRRPGVTDKPVCDECDRPWPCLTIRALDGDA